MEAFATASVLTNDGVRIHYLEAGEGDPVVLLPGFSQSALEFDKQITDLSRDYRVIAMDHRGHGRSDKPAYGYRVSRLAADLRDLLDDLQLSEVVLLGHSLGCSVIWSYWDLFGGDRISRLILVDQPAVVAATCCGGSTNRRWSSAGRRASSAPRWRRGWPAGFRVRKFASSPRPRTAAT